MRPPSLRWAYGAEGVGTRCPGCLVRLLAEIHAETAGVEICIVGSVRLQPGKLRLPGPSALKSESPQSSRRKSVSRAGEELDLAAGLGSRARSSEMGSGAGA